VADHVFSNTDRNKNRKTLKPANIIMRVLAVHKRHSTVQRGIIKTIMIKSHFKDSAVQNRVAALMFAITWKEYRSQDRRNIFAIPEVIAKNRGG